MKYFRQLFIICVFSFVLVIITLSIARHYYTKGTRILGEKEEVFIFLSKIIPNIYHFLTNNGNFVENLLVEKKKDINISKFNIPGLYPYLSEEGWVILDHMENSKTIIPILLNDVSLKNLLSKTKNNLTSFPTNPLKINQNLFFIVGTDLIKYNTQKNIHTTLYGSFHHSLELFQDSLLYACTYGKDTFPNLNDAFMIINIKNGKIIIEKSISEILIENNYKNLLYGSSLISIGKKETRDIIHLNDVQPIRKKTNFADVGDILISMAKLSTVMLYRPKTNKILWLSQGPWFHQHDVDVLNENEIGVYNNNYYSINFFKNETSHISTFNFQTKKYNTLHEETFKNLNIKSLWGSRFEILDNGNMFVEDSPSGTYYLINPEGKLISRKSFTYKNNLTSTGVWARPYTKKSY